MTVSQFNHEAKTTARETQKAWQVLLGVFFLVDGYIRKAFLGIQRYVVILYVRGSNLNNVDERMSCRSSETPDALICNPVGLRKVWTNLRTPAAVR